MGIVDTYAVNAVTITPKGTRSASGAYTYNGTAVNTRARVVQGQGVRRYGTDTEWVYEIVVYFKPTETIALQDQVTWNGLKFKVKEMNRVRDLTGVVQYYKAYCG